MSDKGIAGLNFIILDACALLAFLDKEDGGACVNTFCTKSITKN
jgi:PIN domain nuclease of toxin-antitoxin system